MIQPYDFPERLMSCDPDFFIEKKLSKPQQGLGFFDPRPLAELVKAAHRAGVRHLDGVGERLFGIDRDAVARDVVDQHQRVGCAAE